MQALYDFIPIICFGIFYYFYGIYAATASAMAASALQVIYQWLRYQRAEKIQIVTCGLILVLGGATLAFHESIFIKWKPSVIYWLFGLILLFSQYIKKQPLLESFLGDKITLPRDIWHKLTLAWASFFIVMGALNIYIAYVFSTTTWVYFKVFGTTSISILFIVGQALYLAKHVSSEHNHDKQ